jgi:CRISPR-associated protein Csx17
MTGHVLELRGCTPEPLGNYLKGLGVFRLIAEQADPQARAWWKDGVLHVIQRKWFPSESASAESQCAGWLLQKCHFTPLIAPWQKGTGYLPIGKRETGSAALLELLKSDHPGTTAFRDVFRDFAISVGVSLSDDVSQWLEEIKQAGQDHDDTDLLRVLRNRLRASPSLRWLDAVGMAASRSRDSNERPSWFPLLASGGGEASGQYIVNHQQRLKAVLNNDGQEQSLNQLNAALFDLSQPGALEGNAMGAMYYPSLMKVPNAGQNFLPNPQRRVNPWDFILLLEGCLVWSMATTRRKGVTSGRASFPFYCRSSFGGSTTIGPKEVEGSEKSIAKGELWCPTWEMPSTISEVQRIFGEGRLQVGEKVCSRSLDFALAMTAFGVDRGIKAFHRYSLLERSGSGRQTTLLAVSNGCFVPHRAESLPLLKDLQHFAESVSANLTDNGQQPRRLMLARIEFERSWFGATTSAATENVDATGALSDLVIATGRLNRELGTNSTKPGVVKLKRGEQTSEKTIRPVGGLHRDWLRFIDKSASSPAYRLARAIAGITAWGEISSEGRLVPAVESIRANLLPQRRGRAWMWDDTSRSAVWYRGASLDANLAAVLRRRLIDAGRGSGDGLPLWSSYGAGFEDLLAYWNDEVDAERLTDLLHGLALIDAGTWSESSIDERQKRDEPTPDLQTGGVWFDAEYEARTKSGSVEWNGRSLLSKDDLRAACELPRIYHLLKLCFVGGRLPHRPVEGRTCPRTGEEPFPLPCMDVLTLLQAGRLSDAAQLAARRLRAKGYPSVVRDNDLQNLNMDPDQCRRLVGMLLIPVRQPGVCAALAIRPQTTF